ncbi:MAG: phosphoribosylaminoimidazolesuccinocarboxamide synthase [bacterium]|nr:phosphoribosylaminoimidazolesuccinocarboxamide synthase [bacterium]
MNLEKLELLVQGTSKKLFATNRPSYAILEFTDDAGNPRESRKTSFAGKGEINCGVSSFLFQYLENYHVPTHFVERQSPTDMAVRRVDMFDIKAIVYNVATGEFARRFRLDDGRPLDYPVVEYFLKDPALNNPMVNESHAVALGYGRSDDLRTMQRIATKTNAVLKSLFERRGLLLVEFELEFESRAIIFVSVMNSRPIPVVCGIEKLIENLTEIAHYRINPVLSVHIANCSSV